MKNGDLVLCINNRRHTSLQKGKIYTVQSFDCCQHCNALVLDVGLKLKFPSATHHCGQCDNSSPTISPFIHFAFAKRFVKIDDLLSDCQWQKGQKEEWKEISQAQWAYLLQDRRQERRERLKKIFEELSKST